MPDSRDGQGSPSHPDKPSSRRLFTAALATGAIAPFVPSQWATPIVRSVLIPAHAEATVQAETSESIVTDCTTSFTLPGRQACCDTPVPVQEGWMFTLEDGCLSVESSEFVTPESTQFFVGIEVQQIVDRLVIVLRLVFDGNQVIEQDSSYECVQVSEQEPQGTDPPWQFSVNGNDLELSATLSFDEDLRCVAVSDVVVDLVG